MRTMNERTRAVVRALVVVTAALSLLGAGVSGLAFGTRTMDLVLLQLVFYGVWAALVGAFIGGTLGAAIEEDACGELDMGIMSSMGGILGTLSAGLIGTALTGLAFLMPWQAVWLGFAAAGALHLGLWRLWPYRLVRAPTIDARGCVCGPDGQRLPDEQQPLRMRDRVAILLTISVAAMLGLTLAMALMMGSDLGHPVMMAPMMYGMFGAMLGGMLGGWLAGLLDEHRGAIEHENPVMVGAMALMAGMMGGMPSGMIGAMMAVMGLRAIALTTAVGLILAALVWFVAIRGRYALQRADGVVVRADTASGGPGEHTLVLSGMTCADCVERVQRGLQALPGVKTVDVQLASGRVTLRWGDDFVGLSAVCEAIGRLGYEVRAQDTLGRV